MRKIIAGSLDISKERTWQIVVKVNEPRNKFDQRLGANISVFLVDEQTGVEFAQLCEADIDWGGSLTLGQINRAFNISVT